MPQGNFSPASSESQSTLPSNETELGDVYENIKHDTEQSEKEYPAPFAGMGKEMVLHYSDTPAWNRARKVLLIIFWCSWFILLGAVIWLTVTHERCRLPPALKWFQSASIYQVYPRSFKDSDGNGVGDINGVKEKLGYLRDINVDAVWISPFYKSPMEDFGYDVSSYREIDPVFGTMNDFDLLLEEMHKEDDSGRALKMIIDFIPNHTSDKHEWFEKSVLREAPYDNYYVWKDCGEKSNVTVPNNWISVAGGSAWTYHPIRKQCYFHQYQVTMPDLNIRNNRVKDELDEVLKFWLDKGVDGIRVDAIVRLYEDYNFEDEPVMDPKADKGDYFGNYLNHTKTKDLPEIMDMVNRWRGIIDSYNGSRVIITEAYGAPSVLRMYYGRTKNGGAHLPFNFQLTMVNASSNGYQIAELISDWMRSKPENASANWVLGNHDRSRIGTRVGIEKLDAMNMLLTLLPGVSTTYYGDEIGMLDIDISGIESRDPIGKVDKSRSRDPERSPMQWTADCSSFTSNCSAIWLPLHPNTDFTNVEVESKNVTSHLTVYKNITKLRAQNSFVYGDWKEHVVTEEIYSFLRFYDGVNTYLIAVNIGDTTVKVDLSKGAHGGVTSATVAAITGAVTTYTLGDSADLDKVELAPGDGVVFTWAYIIKQLEL